MDTQKKRITMAEFKFMLSRMPEIPEKAKSYLTTEFSSYLQDGLTEWELKDEINKLKFRDNDGVDNFQLEALKRNLLAMLGK